MADGAAARLGVEFDQAIGESRARIAELVAIGQQAEQKAGELSASARKTWQRRLQMLRNRSIAQQAADLMDG